ncbi:hypothetical protein BDZ91DRAFT_790098 [Kalaharituber pfeilii]|nr:hypothetical protein BDZ91DRAFT_790098 [Kalaharituber pfeilii]
MPAPGEIQEMRKKRKECTTQAPERDGSYSGGVSESQGNGPTSVLKAAGDAPREPNALKKRVWKESWVKEMPDGSFVPHLDSRPLKTSLKQVLAVPSTKPHLAHLIALEWSFLTATFQATRAYLLPLTQLASRVVDLPKAHDPAISRKEIVDVCMKYLDTDTLLCLHPPPNMHIVSEDPQPEGEVESTLRQKQIKTLSDISDWIERNLFPGIVFHPLDTAQGFLATSPQPEQTKTRLRKWIESLDDWTLVGLERCVVSAKSLLVGIRLVGEWKKHTGKKFTNPSTTEAKKEHHEFDVETGAIPPTSASILHNRGTNTGFSHSSAPKPRPEVDVSLGDENAKSGSDIDLSGAITSGDPALNKSTNTSLSTGEQPQKLNKVQQRADDPAVGASLTHSGSTDTTVASANVKSPGAELWGIEEAAKAATLEVTWQTSQWGEVEDTHDVEKEDVRRGLGAGWCLIVDS